MGVAATEGGVKLAGGGGRLQGTIASMPQNVDRARRVPPPLIHGFVHDCASSGVDRVAGTRGDDYCSVTICGCPVLSLGLGLVKRDTLGSPKKNYQLLAAISRATCKQPVAPVSSTRPFASVTRFYVATSTSVPSFVIGTVCP